MNCNVCGKENQSELKYCVYCGSLLENNIKKINKCHNCGSIINSLDLKCEFCGTEIIHKNTESAVQIFTEKINEIERQRNTYHYKNISKGNSIKEISIIDKQKIELIKNFIIPNTKQDIYEFMILAITNFDAEYYAQHLNEEDISDAWLIKIEQCYQKAKLLLENKDKQNIEELYDKISPTIEKAKKKKSEEAIKQEKIQEAQKFKKSKSFYILNVLSCVAAMLILIAMAKEFVVVAFIELSILVILQVAVLMGCRVVKYNKIIFGLLLIIGIVLFVPSCIVLLHI
ncbi:MAG: zinc ribbon domain-containing protein [Clostridia bacterium]|nr:zinc ribbon domain-containing protein [Clostridia bacterium]